MAFIDIIPPDQAEGELQTIYDEIAKSRGSVAEVLQLHSLNPQSMMDHVNLYTTLMFKRSPLKRYQREMIAVVVSAANGCVYCQTHHATALNHFWKDETRVKHIRCDFTQAGLSTADEALCYYAKGLSVSPENAQQSHVDRLKQARFSDRAILDATMITAYFNFVNRMVMGLGAQLEDSAGEGYSYD